MCCDGPQRAAPLRLLRAPAPRPFDPPARARPQFFEAIRYDFSRYALRGVARERAARLHLPAGAALTPAVVAEADGVESLLKACITASFEARAAAYDEEVRATIVSSRDEPRHV